MAPHDALLTSVGMLCLGFVLVSVRLSAMAVPIQARARSSGLVKYNVGFIQKGTAARWGGIARRGQAESTV